MQKHRLRDRRRIRSGHCVVSAIWVSEAPLHGWLDSCWCICISSVDDDGELDEMLRLRGGDEDDETVRAAEQ